MLDNWIKRMKDMVQPHRGNIEIRFRAKVIAVAVILG